MVMQETDNKAKSNIRLALALGCDRARFLCLGMYLATGQQG
jgi:hypothetical protein